MASEDEAARDPDEFSKLYGHVAPALHAWAELRIPPKLRRVFGPEDLVQEVWVRALPRFDKFDAERGPFRAWVFGFAQNVLLAAYKARSKNQLTLAGDDGIDLGAVPVDLTTLTRRLARSDAHQEFIRVVQELDADDQELLLMRGLEGLSHDEIAPHLGVTSATLRKRWQRLRSTLEEASPPDGLLVKDD